METPPATMAKITMLWLGGIRMPSVAPAARVPSISRSRTGDSPGAIGHNVEMPRRPRAKAVNGSSLCHWMIAAPPDAPLPEAAVVRLYAIHVSVGGAEQNAVSVDGGRRIDAGAGGESPKRFAAIGVQLGGIGGMAPERLPDLSRLALRAMTGGFIAACMTGAVVGIFAAP